MTSSIKWEPIEDLRALHEVLNPEELRCTSRPSREPLSPSESRDPQRTHDVENCVIQ